MSAPPELDTVPVASPAADIVARPLPRETGRRLSPINRRRWRNFRANGRGFWSFWLFVVLFVVSLFADFIANDRPILVNYKGEWLSPVLVDYPEEKFGGFLAQTNYRDPVTAREIAENGWAVWPPIRYSYDTHDLNVPTAAPSPPTWRLTDAQCRDAAAKVAPADADRAKLGCRDLAPHWLGTDDQVRDVAAMVIHGFRLSVLFGLILTAVSSVVGVAAGAVQGYFGGWTDLIFQRGIEIWTAIPSLYLLLIIASIITPSFFVLLGILLLFSWVSLVSLVRAEFLRGRNFEYVRAARALGLSDLAIMWRHLLPNAMVATLTFLPFVLNASISTLTSLDFLGFGLPPGSPSLGELLAQGKANTQAPWLGLTGFAVMATMLSLLIFAGEAVRDAFDPRKTFR